MELSKSDVYDFWFICLEEERYPSLVPSPCWVGYDVVVSHPKPNGQQGCCSRQNKMKGLGS